MLSADFVDVVKEKAFCGLPAKLEGVGNVYPIKVIDMIEMGSDVYKRYLSLLLLKEDDISKIIQEKAGVELSADEIPTPIEYLIQSAARNDIFLLELELAFSTFLKEDILVLPELNAIVVGDPKEKRLLDFKNFSDFQDILKIQNRYETPEPPPQNETASERKRRLLREKVAKAKKKKQQSSEKNLTFSELLEIAKVFGISTNESLYAFYGLLRRYQLKEKWQQDIQMICAGADSKNLKTKYWGESSTEE